MQNRNFLLLILISFVVFITSACSKKLFVYDPSSAVFYPSPPDTARVQFLTSFSNSTPIEGQRSGLARFLLGELPVKNIIKPYGITSDSGKIYICDSDLGGLEIIDLQKREFNYFLPKGKGQLIKPINCDIDKSGNLYVVDGNRNQIIVFDPSGNYLDAFGEIGEFSPTDISITSTTIYVVDMAGKKVIAYGIENYSKLFEFPNAMINDEDYLHNPINLFVNDSIVYVSDIGAANVKKYTRDGNYISSFGSYGRNLGQFVRIKGIAVDKELNLYAVDAAFENVQIFNKNDQLLMFIGGPTKELGSGGMWLPTKVTIDYNNIEFFQQYVDPDFTLEYVIYVTNQFGLDKVNVYGFIKPIIHSID